jgi:hypothetical protein
MQQDYLEVVARGLSRRVAGRTFGYEDGYDLPVAKALEAVAIAQDLAWDEDSLSAERWYRGRRMAYLA